AVGYDFYYDDYHRYASNVMLADGDRVYVSKALSRLALEDCFEDVNCFERIESYAETAENSYGWDTPVSVIAMLPILCKPSKEAIEHEIFLANANAQRTIFFDDSPRNIAEGKK
ncbi:hypothetical protein KI387_030985, partial [Taxus chinensis]